MITNYYKPTPKKWRQIGDSILLGTTALSGMMMGAPLSESGKTWCIFILNVIGVVGKVLTNLAKSEDGDSADAPKQ
jgi:hypothetical protein